MFNDVLEALRGLTYAELNSVGKELASFKRVAKEREKDNLEASRQEVVDAVNELIRDGQLAKGDNVIVIYRGQEVPATLNTAPTVEARNLNLASEHFEAKSGSRYTEKYNFVRVD